MLASRQNSEILERAKASGAAAPFGVAIAACRLRGEVANAAEEGEPIPNVHAIQLELSQRTYMNDAHPFEYRPDLAGAVQPILRELLTAILDWAR